MPGANHLDRVIWGAEGEPDTVTLAAGTDATLWIAPEVDRFHISLRDESLTIDFGQGKVRFLGLPGAGSIGLVHGAEAA